LLAEYSQGKHVAFALRFTGPIINMIIGVNTGLGLVVIVHGGVSVKRTEA
jgi:hypothetical protein